MSARIVPAALAASLRRLRQEPPSQVLEKSLDHLVTACVELFGVRGSGLMLADGGGDLRYAVATDPTSQELEDAQLATGQGPCVDTYANDELSLSRFLCKSIYGWSGEVVVDAVGVGQGEGAEGLFPALHDRAFDQSGRGSALAGG
jgi:hypothetical protein